MTPELSREAKEALFFIRRAVGRGFMSGPTQGSDGWWEIAIVRQVTAWGLPSVRKELHRGESPEAAIARARAVIEEDLALASGDTHAAG